MIKPKRLLAATAVAGALSVGAAAPAFSQPVVSGGLVNVTITNLLNNNQVAATVPVSAAAAICNVQVAVLSNLPSGGTTTCNPRTGNQSVSVVKV